MKPIMATSSLTTIESAELAQREAVIAKGVDTFREVGEALQAIRDQRLYRAEFGTFAEYCEKKWQMSRIHAHRMIEASEIVSVLPMGNKITTERTAREVAKIEPAKRAEVVEFAAAKAEAEGRKLTARDISEAAPVKKSPVKQPPAQTVAEKTPVYRKPEYVHCDGLMYADIAILQLEKIQPSDTQRADALRKVITWAERQLAEINNNKN